MSVMVVVPDSPEGVAALAAGSAEARLLGTDLIVVNLGLKELDTSALPADVLSKVINRSGRSDRDPAEAVLDELAEHTVERLVLGIKRRTPTGKALLGSVSQRLLMDAPVPVLAVKVGIPIRTTDTGTT